MLRYLNPAPRCGISPVWTLLMLMPFIRYLKTLTIIGDRSIRFAQTLALQGLEHPLKRYRLTIGDPVFQ
jgi:hypothetical protein